MEKTVIITNVHERGFAFAVTSEGEQVFVPPYAKDGIDAIAGDKFEAVLVPNSSDPSRQGTPWMAVRLMGDQPAAQPATEPEPAPVRSMAALDEEVFDIICSEAYVTSTDIAERAGLDDNRTAGNSANRLFNAGRIAKADVYNRVGQQRASFILYAENAHDFVEAEQ